MGIFDMFKGSKETMTPALAFTASLIYMVAADGEVEEEEIGHLVSLLGSKGLGGLNTRDLLNRAAKYARTTPIDEFLGEAVPLLNRDQRLCLLINLADSLLSDGTAAAEERALFETFLQAFDVSEEEFRPFFTTIVIKNDLSIFPE